MARWRIGIENSTFKHINSNCTAPSSVFTEAVGNVSLVMGCRFGSTETLWQMSIMRLAVITDLIVVKDRRERV